jgi:uncharacterized membrane protein YfcA
MAWGLYAITRKDYICEHLVSICLRRWTKIKHGFDFFTDFSGGEWVIGFIFGFTGICGGWGTPHSLLSSKLMKQATC